MTRIPTIALAVLFSTLLFSCKNKQLSVNPGAHVTVDGTDDGLATVQREFTEASRTDEGVLVTLESDLLFPSNSSYLTEQAKLELDKLEKILTQDAGASIIVNGHTDATGTKEYNQELSEKRAVSVKTYLTGKGISANRITTHGFGIEKPIAPNNTPEGRQKNRRVEIIVVGQK